RKRDVVNRWPVFKEQARRRRVEVLISFVEYSRIVRTACWYCGQYTCCSPHGMSRRRRRAERWHVPPRQRGGFLQNMQFDESVAFGHRIRWKDQKTSQESKMPRLHIGVKIPR
ncbi:unnamed protein product, partial [Ectocarpus sp. 12 AP-2014]